MQFNEQLVNLPSHAIKTQFRKGKILGHGVQESLVS